MCGMKKQLTGLRFKMELSNPWPEGYTINARSPYGWRTLHGKRRFHHGVDVGGSFEAMVAADGVVSHIGWSRWGGGHVVKVDHGEYVSVYYHGADETNLMRGERVFPGRVVYPTGNTGRSFGVHLHYELRKRGGIWGNTVDPVPFLNGTVAEPVLRVTGRLNRETWRAVQRALKAKGMYEGRIDGLPGRMTIMGLQVWAGALPDGFKGPNTRMAVQVTLGVKPDSHWGRITVSALQRSLNDKSF